MTTTRTTNWYALIGVLFLFGVSGCAGRAVMVDLHGAETLNVNEFDEPLPVVVRVYQLSESNVFEEAEFEQLWQHDEALLGDALLAFQEVIVGPEQSVQVTLGKEPDANYVGAMAIFRSPGAEEWRVLEPMTGGMISRFFGRWRHKRLTIHIEQSTLAIQH